MLLTNLTDLAYSTARSITLERILLARRAGQRRPIRVACRQVRRLNVRKGGTTEKATKRSVWPIPVLNSEARRAVFFSGFGTWGVSTNPWGVPSLSPLPLPPHPLPLEVGPLLRLGGLG